MKKIAILDFNTEEIHVFTLPKENYLQPEEFVYDQYSNDGNTFKSSMVSWMVVDLSETEGRLPIYIH